MHFRVGSSFSDNTSYAKQSHLFLHFFRTSKRLSWSSGTPCLVCLGSVYSGARSAQRSPVIMGISSNLTNTKAEEGPPTSDFRLQTSDFFRHQTSSVFRRQTSDLGRRDCVCNLDTPFMCARRHGQMTMKCAYSCVKIWCSVQQAHG